MDPLVFMLAPRSMTDMEYIQWRLGIPFTDQVMDESDYEEFSRTRLMPSFTILVCFLLLLFTFNQSSSAFLYTSNTQMKHLCQEGLTIDAIIDPSHLPWSVYAYGPDDLA